MKTDNEKEIDVKENDVQATDDKQTIDTDTTEASVKDAILNTLTSIFKSEKPNEDAEKNMVEKVVEDEIEDKKTLTFTKEEMDAYIAERAQATIDKMAKTAKEKGVEQANMMKKLENVEPAYVEFIEFQLKKNKDMNINEFLSANPQYKKKMTTKETVTTDGNESINLDKNQINILNSF